MKQISSDDRFFLIALCFSYLLKMTVIVVKVSDYPIIGTVIGFLFPIIGLYILLKK